jgi:hypothetical protein
VTDSISMPRPRSVTVALAILGVSLAITYAEALVVVVVSSTPFGAQQAPRWLVALILSLIFLVPAGLLLAMVRRRRWAYVVALVLFALSVPGTVSGLARHLHPLPVFAGALVFWAAGIVAVILLLRRPAREWFGFGRPPAPPGEWREDPTGRHQLRYWDGELWTEHVADGEAQGTDAIREAPTPVPLTSAST